jgi:hypothetical protein
MSRGNNRRRPRNKPVPSAARPRRKIPLIHLFRKPSEGISAADVIALLAVLVTVGAAVLGASIALQANKISAENVEVTRSGQVKRPGLRIAAATPDLGDELDAKRVIDPEGPPVPAKVTPPVVDITLHNTGDAPALITKATVRFTFLELMSTCLPPGGGPEFLNATYDFTFPTNPVPAVPHEMHKSVRYHVPANDYERFGISVGPEIGFSDNGPWVIVASISLSVDGAANPLTAGPFALIEGKGSYWAGFNPASRGWSIRSAETVNEHACQLDEADKIDRILGEAGMQPSKELSSLGEALSGVRTSPKPNQPPEDPGLRKGDCFVYTGVDRIRRSECNNDAFEVLARMPYTLDAGLCAQISGSNDHSAFSYGDQAYDYLLCTRSRYGK